MIVNDLFKFVDNGGSFGVNHSDKVSALHVLDCPPESNLLLLVECEDTSAGDVK